MTDTTPEAIRIAILAASTAPHRVQAPSGYYLPALASVRGIAGIAAADAGPETEAVLARLGASAPPVRVFRDHRRLLDEVRPALAIVTAPPLRSPELIRAALDAGCHVLADKPAAVTLAAFRDLAERAEQRRRHLMLNFANRFSPLVVEARRRVSAGAIGTLYAADLGTFSDQRRVQEPGWAESWHGRRSTSGGGHLLWLGVHYVDLLQFLTGRRIRRLAGFVRNVGGAPIEVEDAAVVTLELDGGALCTLQSGYYLDRGNRGWITLWGSDGWLRIDMIPDPALEWHSRAAGHPPQVQRQVDRSRFLEGHHQFTPILQAAVDAARGAAPPPVTTAEGLSVLAAIFAAYRAAESGRTEAAAV